MDLVEVFTSSEEEEQHPQSSLSEGARDNVSTDIERSSRPKTKTKNIKKKYDPIEENGKIYHYEDDPSQYKKVRKKIQNRLSARRVRGRKQNAFDNLQQEVQYLRKVNSQLQLSNARLETQNRSLKEQVDFMKGLVKPNQTFITKSDPIEKYLSPQTLTDNNSSIPSSSQYESPFMQDESDWFRLPNRRNSSNNWAMLTIFTLVLAVFVLPSQISSSGPTIMFQTGKSESKTDIISPWSQSLISILVFLFDGLKALLKYLIIFVYGWFVYEFGKRYLNRKKMKKV